MTEIKIVRPFPDDDPLDFEELSREDRALRALMAVLADTGAVVRYPAPELAPQAVSLAVAAGWLLRPDLTPGPGQGETTLAVAWRAGRR